MIQVNDEIVFVYLIVYLIIDLNQSLTSIVDIELFFLDLGSFFADLCGNTLRTGYSHNITLLP